MFFVYVQEEGLSAFGSEEQAEDYVSKILREYKEPGIRIFSGIELFIGEKKIVKSVQFTDKKNIEVPIIESKSLPITKDELIREINRLRDAERKVRDQLDRLG